MKKRGVSLLLVLLFLLALCSCAQKKADSVLRIYYPAVSGEAASRDFVSRSIASRDYFGPGSVEDLTAALLYDLFGEKVKLVAHYQNFDSLRLDLSEEYGELTGIDHTLAECCIVLTLCQLDSVGQVQINVAGAQGELRPYLSPDDMIFTGAEEEPREFSVELYFPRSSGRGLGFETRKLILTEDDDLYTEVTRALLAGPSGPGLHSPFPEDLEILGSKLEGGICHVNFSSHLLELEAPAAERDLLLYSIVDTLGNLDSVTSVQLLVEGEPLLRYGNTDISAPLEPDFGLVSD